MFLRRQSAASEWFICSVYARLLRSFEVKLFDLILVIIETVKCSIDMRITNRKFWDRNHSSFESKPKSTHFYLALREINISSEHKNCLFLLRDCKQKVLKIDFYARSFSQVKIIIMRILRHLWRSFHLNILSVKHVEIFFLHRVFFCFYVYLVFLSLSHTVDPFHL